MFVFVNMTPYIMRICMVQCMLISITHIHVKRCDSCAKMRFCVVFDVSFGLLIHPSFICDVISSRQFSFSKRFPLFHLYTLSSCCILIGFFEYFLLYSCVQKIFGALFWQRMICLCIICSMLMCRYPSFLVFCLNFMCCFSLYWLGHLLSLL